MSSATEILITADHDVNSSKRLSSLDKWLAMSLAQEFASLPLLTAKILNLSNTYKNGTEYVCLPINHHPSNKLNLWLQYIQKVMEACTMPLSKSKDAPNQLTAHGIQIFTVEQVYSQVEEM
ncbi:hypothetical protein FKM82_000866 [Ascaphus truei]